MFINFHFHSATRSLLGTITSYNPLAISPLETWNMNLFNHNNNSADDYVQLTSKLWLLNS